MRTYFADRRIDVFAVQKTSVARTYTQTKGDRLTMTLARKTMPFQASASNAPILTSAIAGSPLVARIVPSAQGTREPLATAPQYCCRFPEMEPRP